jgi:hypothetical protein
MLNSMAWALFRSRQIFKFGLLRKKDNKKNLKIRLVFNRIVTVYFQPYYSYTIPLAHIKKIKTMNIKNLLIICLLSVYLFSCNDSSKKSSKDKVENTISNEKQNPEPYQSKSYTDDFYYKAGRVTNSTNNFNNWFWEIYPNNCKGPNQNICTCEDKGGGNQYFDKWVSFSFNEPVAPGSSNYCAHLTVKKAPQNDTSPSLYQDAEIFNNGSFIGQNSGRVNVANQSPCNNCAFPYGRLKDVTPPYQMNSSCASSEAMYLEFKNYAGKWNCPYYPSDSVAYRVKTRVKAVGRTIGTRGWGFWNTTGTYQDLRYAWFFEMGIPNAKEPNKPTLVLTAITHNGKNICISLLEKDIYDNFHDYEIIWSANAVEYKIDGIEVAMHNNPPPANSNGSMAYHNWVDNAVYHSKGKRTHPKLAHDKTNIIDNFVAAPVFNYKQTQSKNKYNSICIPLSVSKKDSMINEGGRSEVMSIVLEELMKEYGDELQELKKINN